MKPRQPCVSLANPDEQGDESDLEERDVRAVVLVSAELDAVGALR